MTDVYKEQIGTTQTPQDEAIPGRENRMKENEAGGYSFEVDNWTRLRRFLILGSEQGTYYTGRRDLTRENVSVLMRLLDEDGPTVVQMIVDIMSERAATSASPSLFALAVAAKDGDMETRQAAAEALPDVAQYPTHLFEFLDYVREMGGLGRALRNAVSDWYNDRDPDQLAYWFIKYRQRNGWTHRDVLLLAHVAPRTAAHDRLYGYVASRDNTSNVVEVPDHTQIQAFEAIKNWSDPNPEKVADLIRNYNLPREAIPSELRNATEVWDALLDGMPSWALLRNLNTLTEKGVIDSLGGRTSEVVEKLENLSGVHPVQILASLITYESGSGYRGSKTWTPVPAVVDALDDAFYDAFDEIEPTGRSQIIGIDVSGSMGGTKVRGLDMISATKAAAAMALVGANSSDPHQFVKFNTSAQPVSVSPRERLDDVVKKLRPGGGTDVASVVNWARDNGHVPDAFVIYTDSQTWAGRRNHPQEAVEKLREESGKDDIKLVVVNMAANDISVADHQDPRTLDVVGFDTQTPDLINRFLRDEF